MISTRREDLLARLAQDHAWDMVVVGGGATGLGVALLAAQRGLSVALLESHDFASGTSSRSTKLLHGGVRYLAQGNLSLVREALHERAAVLAQAPALAHPLRFVLPAYRWWEQAFYGIGLNAYAVLAGRHSLGATRWLSAAQTLQRLPGARAAGLCGGVEYWDGQFDDARLAVALACTAAARGALLLNHCEVIALRHETAGAATRVSGLTCRDRETGRHFGLRTRCVVNATGVWVDGLRAMDPTPNLPGGDALVQASQGVHLVVDREFLGGDSALLIPRTRDGRVLFAVPWLGKVLLGTTDTPRDDAPREPLPLREEVDFILGEASRYLARPVTREDVRSVWAGLRPLVRPAGARGGAAPDTGAISREHTVLVSPRGLVSVTGGKWTTFEAMARDVLQECTRHGLIDATPPGPSAPLTVNATCEDPVQQARFSAEHEFARTVEDVLARRSRLLFLDARVALAAAPAVARALQAATGHDPGLAGFEALARQYASLP